MVGISDPPAPPGGELGKAPAPPGGELGKAGGGVKTYSQVLPFEICVYGNVLF